MIHSCCGHHCGLPGLTAEGGDPGGGLADHLAVVIVDRDSVLVGGEESQTPVFIILSSASVQASPDVETTSLS